MHLVRTESGFSDPYPQRQRRLSRAAEENGLLGPSLTVKSFPSPGQYFEHQLTFALCSQSFWAFQPL